MKLKDTIIIPAMLAPLVTGGIIGFSGYGWEYFITIFAFYILFGFMELVSKKKHGKSISQEIASTPPLLFWSVIIAWFIMHTTLIVHWIMMR